LRQPDTLGELRDPPAAFITIAQAAQHREQPGNGSHTDLSFRVIPISGIIHDNISLYFH
jgi:hypothetical protein